MDAGGEVVEVEEQVPIEKLPAAVRDGLETKAGEGKLVKVESLTKKGKLVAVRSASSDKWETIGDSGRP